MSRTQLPTLVAVCISVFTMRIGAEPEQFSGWDLSSPLRAYETYARAILAYDAQTVRGCLHLERQLDQPWVDGLLQYLEAAHAMREVAAAAFGAHAANQILARTELDDLRIVGRAARFLERIDEIDPATVEQTQNWALIDAFPLGCGVLRLHDNDWRIATTPSFEGFDESKQLNDVFEALLGLETPLFQLQTELLKRTANRIRSGNLKSPEEVIRSRRGFSTRNAAPATKPS